MEATGLGHQTGCKGNIEGVKKILVRLPYAFFGRLTLPQKPLVGQKAPLFTTLLPLQQVYFRQDTMRCLYNAAYVCKLRSAPTELSPWEPTLLFQSRPLRLISDSTNWYSRLISPDTEVFS